MVETTEETRNPEADLKKSYAVGRKQEDNKRESSLSREQVQEFAKDNRLGKLSRRE